MSDKTKLHPEEIRVHEYLDEALDPEARGELEAHLAYCSHCLNRLEELRSLFSALETLADLHLKRDFTSPVLNAIRPPIKVSPTLRVLAWVQAIVAMVLFILAWPSLAIEKQFSPIFETGEQILLTVEDNIPQVPALLTALQSRINEIATQKFEFALPEIPISTSAYPALGLWLLIGSAALLWLVGNRSLLYPLIQNQPSNTNHT